MRVYSMMGLHLRELYVYDRGKGIERWILSCKFIVISVYSNVMSSTFRRFFFVVVFSLLIFLNMLIALKKN